MAISLLIGSTTTRASDAKGAMAISLSMGVPVRPATRASDAKGAMAISLPMGVYR
jgi:hypothetical protein